MPLPKALSIVIVNFNGASFIQNCLDSVLSQTKFFSDFNIIVVDNASTDNSLAILNKYANHITLIQNKVNVGFAAAHNQLLDDLNCKYLWLLNNDTEFDSSVDTMTPILRYMDQHPDVVGVSPKLLNTDGSIQHQGSRLNQWVYRKKKPSSVRFLSGAALFIRHDFFQLIDGFDPHLFFYNDDVDFAFQAKRHGKKLAYFPGIQVTHHGGLSTTHNPVSTQVGGYFGSAYLCKKYYPFLVFVVYRQVLELMIWLKRVYYKVMQPPNASEWLVQLTMLKKRLRHDL